MTEVLMWHSKKPRRLRLRGFSIPFWVGGLIPRLATSYNNAIAIIGGVDGPTSVFVAGKLNSVLVSILLIAIGVVMLIVAIIFYFLKKK